MPHVRTEKLLGGMSARLKVQRTLGCVRLELVFEALGNNIFQIFAADIHAKVVRGEQPPKLLGDIALLGSCQVAEVVLYPLLFILRMVCQRKRSARVVLRSSATGVRPSTSAARTTLPLSEGKSKLFREDLVEGRVMLDVSGTFIRDVAEENDLVRLQPGHHLPVTVYKQLSRLPVFITPTEETATVLPSGSPEKHLE